MQSTWPIGLPSNTMNPLRFCAVTLSTGVMINNSIKIIYENLLMISCVLFGSGHGKLDLDNISICILNQSNQSKAESKWRRPLVSARSTR